jgi:hypothetical protein
MVISRLRGRLVAAVCLAWATLALPGCSLFIDRAVDGASSNLTAAILNQDDPETVRDGAPAYLLLMDSLVEGSPTDAGILQGASGLYAAYAGVFVDDPERARRLASRARDYGSRGLCAEASRYCGIDDLAQDEFQAVMDEADREDVPALYAYALGWLVWLKANSDDFQALVDLPRVESVLERIIELDEGYERGSAHVYTGVLQTLLPPALGGRPEPARMHFERAIELSDGRDLSAKVEYARSYARLLYERELHDRLLTEVLEADPTEPGLTLFNTLAQRDALALLETADDYF